MYPYLSIGSLQIPMYGLCILIGVSLGVILAMRRAKRTTINPDDILFAVTYTAVGAILGGKLFYVITSWDTIRQNASYYFTSFAGFREFFSYGFVFYGGLILGLLVFIFYSKKHKLNVGDMINLIIPVVPLAHGVGRIGCFCAGCCYGMPMDPPWGVYFNSPLAPHDVALFPVQLLEAGLNILLFAFLFYYTRKARKPGKVLGLYLVCYAIERFFLEYLRYDAIRGFIFGMSTSQFISLLLIPVGLLLIFVKFEEKIGLPALAGVDAGLEKKDTAEETDDVSQDDAAASQGSAEETVEPEIAAKESEPDEDGTIAENEAFEIKETVEPEIAAKESGPDEDGTTAENEEPEIKEVVEPETAAEEAAPDAETFETETAQACESAEDAALGADSASDDTGKADVSSDPEADTERQ